MKYSVKLATTKQKKKKVQYFEAKAGDGRDIWVNISVFTEGFRAGGRRENQEREGSDTQGSDNNAAAAMKHFAVMKEKSIVTGICIKNKSKNVVTCLLSFDARETWS